jgi:chloramphenicol 3-O phosphotransferase
LPGIGLRPGEETHPATPFVRLFYAALYDSVGAHSRTGLNVVVDVGHHDAEVLAECARRLDGLPALLVGVRCPINVIMERRKASAPGSYATRSAAEPVPAPVRRWQHDVHVPRLYDLEVDTSRLSPGLCAGVIRQRLEDETAPTALRKLTERAR